MAVTLDAARKLLADMERLHALRHREQGQLRQFWHGHYWERVDDSSHGIASIFKDLRSTKADVGPELKIVRNVLQEVCVKFQTYIAPTPQIRVPSDDPSSTRARNQADVKLRCLYGLWEENAMDRLLANIGWYLPLMADCFLGAVPDMDKKVVRAILRSPENAYPVPTYDLNGQPRTVLFAWKVRESDARREFPNYNEQLALPENSSRSRRADPDPQVQILEYSDEKEFARWVGEQKVNGVEHDLGFNLFDQVKFINVPDEAWGHGAVEQIVGRVELGNALASLIFDAALENVYPTMVIVKPQSAPEEILRGPGSVVPVSEGGSVSYLSPPTGSIQAQQALLLENERSIKEGSSMPDVNFGQFDASIITGAAINELQGAGTGSVVEFVQGVGIGGALTSWNSKAMYMLRRMWPNDQLYLSGYRPRSNYDVHPQEFAWKHKGKEIVGSLRNVVVFSPYVGLHEKVIMQLQLLGGGLISKKHAREGVGIADPDSMEQEIVEETLDGFVLQAIEAAFQQDPTQPVEQVEQKAAAALEGLPPPTRHPLLDIGTGSGAPPPALGPGGPAASGGPGGPPPPPGGPPGTPAGVGPTAGIGGSGPVIPPTMPPGVGPPGAVPPPGMPAPPMSAPGSPVPASPSGPGKPVTLPVAIAAFQAVQGIAGKVFLMGEIVTQQQTSGSIEVGLTDPADRQTLADGLPQFAGMLTFHPVTGIPSEPHVEVTPGVPVRPGGKPVMSPDELHAPA